MNESQVILASVKAKRAADEEIDPSELLAMQSAKIRELKAALRDETARAERAEADARDLRERVHRESELRPSLEVLQRMANGLDPFDIGRFKCAMAALPHEVPRLSASVNMTGSMSIADQLDTFNRERQKAAGRGLRVIDAEPEPAA
jgi:cytochrome c556